MSLVEGQGGLPTLAGEEKESPRRMLLIHNNHSNVSSGEDKGSRVAHRRGGDTSSGIERNHTFESLLSDEECPNSTAAAPANDRSGGEDDSDHSTLALRRETDYKAVFESPDDDHLWSFCFAPVPSHIVAVVYISTFAVFGTVIRTYFGRFFGLDCNKESNAVDDFMTRVSTQICVTSNGKTASTGGALFTDLPANMLGCFIIGVLTPALDRGHPLPWLRKGHPLQTHEAFHTALKVGL
jgi:hypothetical protein